MHLAASRRCETSSVRDMVKIPHHRGGFGRAHNCVNHCFTSVADDVKDINDLRNSLLIDNDKQSLEVQQISS